MTRYTNVGRKRTYVQAGFNNDGDADVIRESNLQTDALASFPLSNHATPVSTEPPKKKHRGGKARQSKRIGKDLNAATTSIGVESSGEVSVEAESTPGSQPLRKAVKSRDKKGAKSADARKFASEQRRLKRQDLRHLDTVCFACREKGHSAKACPKTSGFCEEKGGENRSKRRSSKPTVGICYRCGSRRHNLSKCPKPIDHENPLPFASCFVCSAIGHLAGSCPNNQEKGVYPNGGCCKLCGQTTHLAKDCDLRKQDTTTTKLFVGTGEAVGADEDDFHSFKRRAKEVSRDEKGENKLKRMQVIKQGAYSGVVKAFGNASGIKPSKVVTF